VERLIGTIRREYLDCVFFLSALDLTRKLTPSAITTIRCEYIARLMGRRPHNALAPRHLHP